MRRWTVPGGLALLASLAAATSSYDPSDQQLCKLRTTRRGSCSMDFKRQIMAELIHEHPIHVRTPEGKTYVPRTYGQQQASGMWEGWLEFDPIVGRGPKLRTERETSQATRDALEVWAAGLQAVYFEGAFERARVLALSQG